MSLPSLETAMKQEEEYLHRVHPTVEETPTCMKMLDDFLSCNVFGPQFKSLYRYGHVSYCRPKFEDFKYCMSLRSEDEEEKRRLLLRRRAEWWAKRRMEKSSENVWELRTEPLKDWPPPNIQIDFSTTSGSVS